MRFWQRLEKTIERTVIVAAGISGIAALTSCFLLSTQASIRYIFNYAWSLGVEANRWAILAIFSMPLAYTLAKGGHVAVDLIPVHYPPKLKTTVNVIGMLLTALFSFWMLWATWRYAFRELAIGEFLPGFQNVPLFPFLIFIPIGFFLLLVQSLILLVREAHKLVPKGHTSQ